MPRLLGLLAATLCWSSTAFATVVPAPTGRLDSDPIRRAVAATRSAGEARPAEARPAEPRPAADAEFNLTAQTEVLLDGRPCAYRDIPRTATIARIELAADRKTVLRIEFKSRK